MYMYVLSVRMYPWLSICMPGSQFLRGHWALTFVRFACSRASHRLPFCLAATSTICAWMPARPVSKWSVANSINGCMLGCVEKGLSGRKTEHRKSLAAPRDVATFSGGRCHILFYSICTNPVSGKGMDSLWYVLWIFLIAMIDFSSIGLEEGNLVRHIRYKFPSWNRTINTVACCWPNIFK